MSVVLYKSSSGTAREASLAALTTADPGVAPAAVPEPDERDLELARLRVERDSLRKQLAAAEQKWDQDLSEIATQSRKAAALEFQQDDDRRFEALVSAVEGALTAFQDSLIAGAQELAPRLARLALERLVKAREAESDWLRRTIEQRLDRLAAGSVIALQIAAADCSDDLVRRLSQRFAPGVEVTADPALKPGTARIVLRLGEVPIDFAGGVKQLVALLANGDGDE